jgi:hypothetical protein
MVTMKRLLLYPFLSVVVLAGEPAVGATMDGALVPRRADPQVPLCVVVSTLSSWFESPRPLGSDREIVVQYPSQALPPPSSPDVTRRKK